MFKNCYYSTRKSQIHLWEQINGEDLYDIIDWTPYVYLPTIEGEEDAKTIYGSSVKKRSFQSYNKYIKFLKDKNPNVYENNVKPEIQFLAERYHGIPDEDMYVPDLLIYYLDIEVVADRGFPDWQNPEDPIILISLRNSKTKETVTFGYDVFGNREYEGDIKGVKYIKCEDEEILLRRFFNFMKKYPCDVLSGYNIGNGKKSFDLPYIINRAKVLWGEELGKKLYSRMSPIGVVRVWKQQNSEDINIDITGITILDYYDVYRWYGKNLERYTLEYVSQTVLGVGKLPNPYETHREFAEKDWSKFTDYNIIDCERVNDLEEQLGYIRMIQSLSLLCKSPMMNYNAQTKLIEGLMITRYRRDKLCAPYFAGGEQEGFTAAHVKNPQIGMHKWVVDIDITSSYPSHIIALNMSIETFFGRILNMQESEVISYTKKREFPGFSITRENGPGEWQTIKFNGDKLNSFNLALEKGLLAIAPCGSIFTTNKNGVISKAERELFFKRKEVKGIKKEWGLKADECDGDEKTKCLEKKLQAHSLQLALKIMMNAFFGILSVPYSRYHNVHIAEAITSCGRHTIKSGEKFANELLNNPDDSLSSIIPSDRSRVSDHEKSDYIIYIDTDSLFVDLGRWTKDYNFDEYWDSIDDDGKILLIKKISACMEKYIDDRIFNETQICDYNSKVRDFKIGFKQEIIAKTALFLKKKKYAYWLRDEEGIPSDEIKVTGLEIIRSESAEAIRPRLKNIMEMIMRQVPDEEIGKKVRQYRRELLELDPESLAANIGINGIKKYLKTGHPISGTPWHVKGVWGYRTLLKELDIVHKYEDIYEGVKSKVIYAKKNPYNVETVAFTEWPLEFNDIIQFDTHTMVDKFFIKKVEMLLDPINKKSIIEKRDSFKAFF